MPEERKSRYTEAQAKAVKKYLKESVVMSESEYQKDKKQ